MCRLSVSVHQNMSVLLLKRRVKEIIVLLTVTLAVFTHSVTINKVGHPEIVAKSRVALRPIVTSAFLNDIIRISAPVINDESVYYLNKPNGDVMKLDIKSPKLRHLEPKQEIQPIVARFIKDMKPIICQENNNDVFALPPNFQTKLDLMEENDFMIGPLTMEDHGNWMLSVYTKDFNDDWIELFQDISVTITDYVPLRPSKETLNLGDALNVSIAFPIPDLESCELVAPRSTFDRFYDRNQIDISACGFTIPNITVEDVGTWKIIAVGKMVYEGEMNLNVNNINSTYTRIVID